MLKHWAGALLMLVAVDAKAAPLQVALPEIIPLSFITPEGQKLGLYVELLAAISKEADIALQLNITPFARSVNMMNQGKSDLAVHYPTAIDTTIVRQLGVLHQTDLVLWPRPAMSLSHKAQLNGKIVGRLRGGCQRVFQPTAVQFYEINEYTQGVRMLEAKRLDALCGSREAISFAIHRNALPALEVGQALKIEQMQVALLARKDLPKPIMDRLQRATSLVMKSALPQQLHSRYGLK